MNLFSLAWPIFIETALFMLLGLVDVFILSGYDDLAALERDGRLDPLLAGECA